MAMDMGAIKDLSETKILKFSFHSFLVRNGFPEEKLSAYFPYLV